MKKGPRAVIECPEEIPCNPCEAACPRHAIAIGQPITNVPVLDEDKCTGCGLCIAACPGLAIFVVDPDYREEEATVTFPYEYLPVPKVGDTVKAVDRRGTPVCDARVIGVLCPPLFDHTRVITVSVPKGMENKVRSIAGRRGSGGVGR